MATAACHIASQSKKGENLREGIAVLPKRIDFSASYRENLFMHSEEEKDTSNELTQDLNNQQYLFLVVHGVGQQKRYETVYEFITGWSQAHNGDMTFTRASIAHEIEEKKAYSIKGTNIHVAEFRYSEFFEEHADLADSKTDRTMIKVLEKIKQRFREVSEKEKTEVEPSEQKLKETEMGYNSLIKNLMRKDKEHDAKMEFNLLNEFVVIGWNASQLLMAISKRLNILSPDVPKFATHFIQQIELFIEYPNYRDTVIKKLAEQITANAQNHPDRQIVLVAHSLGTVVAMGSILRLAREKNKVIERIKWFYTFGSPLDLFTALFPHTLSLSVEQSESNSRTRSNHGNKESMRWVNYVLANDIVASKLQLTRSSIGKLSITDQLVPETVLIGQGGLLSAHTDYWTNRTMMMDISKSIKGRNYIPKKHPAFKWYSWINLLWLLWCMSICLLLFFIYKSPILLIPANAMNRIPPNFIGFFACFALLPFFAGLLETYFRKRQGFLGSVVAFLLIYILLQIFFTDYAIRHASSALSLGLFSGYILSRYLMENLFCGSKEIRVYLRMFLIFGVIWAVYFASFLIASLFLKVPIDYGFARSIFFYSSLLSVSVFLMQMLDRLIFIANYFFAEEAYIDKISNALSMDRDNGGLRQPYH